MKRNIGTKLGLGLLGAIMILTATRVVVRSNAAESEARKAQVVSEALEARARHAEAERPNATKAVARLQAAEVEVREAQAAAAALEARARQGEAERREKDPPLTERN